MHSSNGRSVFSSLRALRTPSYLFAIAAAALLGLAGESLAVPITLPTGLNPGDQYRLAFVTSTTTSGASSSISTYNNLVLGAANTQAALVALGTTWNAIASVLGVNAYDNTGTNPASTGVPIYLLNGTTLIAINNVDLWDNALLAPLNVDQTGGISNTTVWTGTFPSGIQDNSRYLGASFPRIGDSGSATAGWMNSGNSGRTALFPVFGISGILTVPEPGTALMLASGLFGLTVIGRRKEDRVTA